MKTLFDLMFKRMSFFFDCFIAKSVKIIVYAAPVNVDEYLGRVIHWLTDKVLQSQGWLGFRCSQIFFSKMSYKNIF